MQYLIAYYTKTGTTAEIARELAQALQAQDKAVDTLPLEQVGDLTPYSHVVVGAPINGMQWAPQAQEFLQQHAPELARTELSLYAVSYVYPTGRRFWRRIIRKGIDSLQAQYGAVRSTVFRGRIGSPMPGAIRLLFGIRSTSPLDLRDTDEVADLAEKL